MNLDAEGKDKQLNGSFELAKTISKIDQAAALTSESTYAYEN